MARGRAGVGTLVQGVPSAPHRGIGWDLGVRAKSENIPAWLALHPAAPSSTPEEALVQPAMPVPLGLAAADVGLLPLVAQRLLEL